MCDRCFRCVNRCGRVCGLSLGQFGRVINIRRVACKDRIGDRLCAVRSSASRVCTRPGFSCSDKIRVGSSRRLERNDTVVAEYVADGVAAGQRHRCRAFVRVLKNSSRCDTRDRFVRRLSGVLGCLFGYLRCRLSNLGSGVRCLSSSRRVSVGIGVLVGHRLGRFGSGLDICQYSRSLGDSFCVVRVDIGYRCLNSLELQFGASGRFSSLCRRSESSSGGSGDGCIGAGGVSCSHGLVGGGLRCGARGVERRRGGRSIHGGIAHSRCHSRCLGGILAEQGGHGIGPR